jgi:UPF0716 protein FxsA
MLRYIGLLLLIPLVDALFLVGVTWVLGWKLVTLLVVLTAFLGLFLVRLEGRNTLAKIQRKAAKGESPTDELLDGVLLLVSGAFLLTPGLITDTIGFLLVVPLSRYPIRVALKKWVVMPYVENKTNGFASGNVYIGGFPGGDPTGTSGAKTDASGGQSSSDSGDSGFEATHDVEFEDSEREK